MPVQMKWTGLALHLYSLHYTKILDPVNLWRFGLRPRPNDLLAHIITPKDLPEFKALKEEMAVAQPSRGGS